MQLSYGCKTCVLFFLFGAEIVEERAGHEKEFLLTCRHLDSRIAILDAIFTPTNPRELNEGTVIELPRIEDEPYPVRLALNQR